MENNFIKTFTLEIKKSKFIAYSFDIDSKEQVGPIIESLKEQNPKARHVCYAFKVANTAGMSDDGEPSGTAGKPIFKLLEMKGIENTLVAVVRYFGGKKLGAGGLIRAYVGSAKEVI